MRLISYLLATLLTVAPAPAKQNGCTHYQVYYRVPCTPGKLCAAVDTPKEQWKENFKQNREAWQDWADKQGNGGYCGGWCKNVDRQYMPGSAWTWSMRCIAPRMKRKTETAMPNVTMGLERTSEHRECNVNCSPNSGSFVNQGCGFIFGDC
ncbi:hypothetical protein FKW77_003751 [Venturia effusa]|uniref:Secreted protein n=1 Tax=Venturia effusa TaxID=50376 RepID=A0A517LK73_9PEZI|nr:hypothetical protein FKW77_003751 [Venturia effusa]